MTPFTLPRLERVLSGAGSLASLAAELDRGGCTRAVVVTGRTLAASPLVARITDQLDARLVFVFDGARQHVPSGTVQALVDAARQHRADGFVSVGGGSPIDTAKAAVHALIAGAGGEPPLHVAVPTTLSAGEFTDVAGITDEATRVKHAVYDARIAPRVVIADPEATRLTPAWLWAASGIRALDHAIETLYASRRHPISQPLAVRGIEMLVEHLPASVRSERPERLERPTPNAQRPKRLGALGSWESEVGGFDGSNDSNDLQHRGECQMAAWLAVFGVTNAGFGLSHVLGHQIGPRWNVAHGVTSAVMLPHAMRFMADAVPERFAPIAHALRVPFDDRDPRRGALACADRVAAFIAQFNLPRCLRDVSVPAGETGEIVRIVCGILDGADLIDRPITGGDLASLLTAAY